MVSLRDAISNSVQNFMCSASADAAPFGDWLSGAVSNIPGVSAANRAGTAIADGVGALVCPGPSGGQSGGGGASVTYPSPDAQIGQCDGVQYRGIFDYTRSDGLVTNAGIPPVWGPTGAITVDPSPQGNRVLLACRGGGGGPIQPAGTIVTIATASNPEFGNPVITSLTRLDGQPDDCGEAASQQPPEGTDQIDYDGPDGQPITGAPITIKPRFPVIGPGGVFGLPIEVCLAVVCFDVNFNLSTGDITFNFGGNPGASPCCPPPKELPEEGGEDDPPPPEDDIRYSGVITKARLNGEATKITQIGDGIGPDLFLPKCGVIRFAIEIGGRRSWTRDQEIKQNDQVTFVNAPMAAYSWTILPYRGFDISATGVQVDA